MAVDEGRGGGASEHEGRDDGVTGRRRGVGASTFTWRHSSAVVGRQGGAVAGRGGMAGLKEGAHFLGGGGFRD